MAFSKANRFNTVTYHQSIWAKAQAYPARIMIMTHLLENGRTSFEVLRKNIPLARTTVCQHLRILRDAKLIQAEDEFPHTYYTLNHTLCKSLAEKFRPLNQSFLEKDQP
jgi:ArsR family transcriptional regulator